jgi:hypothetical protein
VAQTTVSGPVDVPARFTAQGIFVTAAINGHPTEMLLDTGASTVALTFDDARADGVKATGKTDITGVGGVVSMRTGVVDDIVIGPAHLLASDAVIRGSVRSLLGATLFDNYAVVVDFLTKHVSIYPKGTFQATSMTVPGQPVVMFGGIGRIPVGFGTHEASFDIDTGAERTIIFREFGDALLGKRFVGYADMQGIGTEEFTVYRLDDVAIGGFHFKGFATWIQARPAPQSRYYDGYLGRDFLEALKVTFDYPDGTVYFER